MKYILLLIIAVSCNRRETQEIHQPGEVPATSQHLNFIGLYQGSCDDCPDSVVTLQLSENFAYTIDGQVNGSGSYQWSPEGNSLILKRNGLPDVKLKTSHKALIFESTGDTLFKVPEAKAGKTDARPQLPAIPAARWTLIELNGKATRKLQKDDFFINIAIDNTFTAFAGCNSIGGKFKISGSTIQFIEVVQTEMACEGALLERPFTDALNAADNFIRNGKMLQLRKGQSVLAKFEAIAQPDAVR